MTAHDTSTTTRARAGGPRHGALVAHRLALALLLLAVVVQFFLAGLGAFGGGFDAHVTNGYYVIPALALVVLVLGPVARVGTRDVVLSAVLVLLVVFGQSLFKVLADEGAFWGGLHALDGLVVLGITGFLHTSAVRRLRATPGEERRSGRSPSVPA
ncbi:DUF6220 domain-containing protein [Geodermatophilus sp. SYSU D00698]